MKPIEGYHPETNPQTTPTRAKPHMEHEQPITPLQRSRRWQNGIKKLGQAINDSILRA